MNSPAIRHSKKHRQSLSVVSWLSKAVEYQWHSRWLALLYPGLYGKQSHGSE